MPQGIRGTRCPSSLAELVAAGYVTREHTGRRNHYTIARTTFHYPIGSPAASE